MIASKRARLFYAGLILTLAVSSAAIAAPATIASLDLSKSFATRSLWSFQASESLEPSTTFGAIVLAGAVGRKDGG